MGVLLLCVLYMSCTVLKDYNYHSCVSFCLIVLTYISPKIPKLHISTVHYLWCLPGRKDVSIINVLLTSCLCTAHATYSMCILYIHTLQLTFTLGFS